MKKEEASNGHPSSSGSGLIRSQADASITDEKKSKLTMIEASSKQLPKHPVHFTADELCHHLQPVIEKMLACEDSHPFRQPVDPVALNILDYPKIIKRPMDISTIQMKLLQGDYQNPLQLCDDAWLMFNNAWLYNKKTTRIYKMCTKVRRSISFDRERERERGSF